MASSGKILRWLWDEQGLALQNGASHSDIANLEKKYDCKLPESFVDYLLTINGMQSNDVDNSNNRFWPIEELKSWAEFAPEQASKDGSLYLVFADHLIWSHFYAIELTPTSKRILMLGGTANEVAKDFNHFVELYKAHKLP